MGKKRAIRRTMQRTQSREGAVNQSSLLVENQNLRAELAILRGQLAGAELAIARLQASVSENRQIQVHTLDDGTPVYTQEQVEQQLTDVVKNVDKALNDYVWDYFVPYAQAASYLQLLVQEMVNAVLRHKNTPSGRKELFIWLKGMSDTKGWFAELTGAFVDLRTKAQAAGINKDFPEITNDISAWKPIIAGFMDEPSEDNHQALIEMALPLAGGNLLRIWNMRAELDADLGRRPGLTHKNELIWELAAPYYKQLGAENAGAKVIEILEARDNRGELEYEALEHLRYVQTGGKGKIKRDGKSLANLITQIKGRAKNWES